MYIYMYICVCVCVYPVFKKKEILLFKTTGMNMENIKISEISQAHRKISLTHGIKKVELTEAEIRMVVTKVRKWGDDGQMVQFQLQGMKAR